MARRGRPKLRTVMVRSKSLVIRLRPVEHEQIWAAAKAAGRGLAPFARLAVLEAADRQVGAPAGAPVDPVDTHAGVRRELRRIGINLNQVAKALNSRAAVGQCAPALFAQVEELRDLLLQELER